MRSKIIFVVNSIFFLDYTTKINYVNYLKKLKDFMTVALKNIDSMMVDTNIAVCC